MLFIKNFLKYAFFFQERVCNNFLSLLFKKEIVRTSNNFLLYFFKKPNRSFMSHVSIKKN